MKSKKIASLIFVFILLLVSSPMEIQGAHYLKLSLSVPLLKELSLYLSQMRQFPRTPLSQETLNSLANEISGQIIYNNEIKLAGAPWLRDIKEFSETFYESGKIHEIARGYGIETIRLDRYKSDRKIDYPLEGEFWIVKPEKKLVARLESDAALIASGSSSVDITGELIYIPPLTKTTVEEWIKTGADDQYKGKVALMWTFPRGESAKALDSAGITGVISFNARDKYFDPDQVVYSRGSFSNLKDLKFGFSISWRQWSELLEDVVKGKKYTVKCRTKIGNFDDKFESVFAWIPGTETDEKGVIFSAHLFEGYTKRGANDNMSGCVVQLEILRALSKLIAEKILPQPRRTIYFLWPNEISGTYEHFKQNPGFAEKLSTNINMDMVGEALRKNNAIFTMSESPNHLPSYMDGLAKSIMNYVWRTNDIVYLPDSPRGRAGQHFPQPLWEKNGSRDAFRFFIHRATGGSDHICFNNPSIAVPGIELFTWPDQWYHADTDTPDKSDPTQMKRVAFIGAAMAWAAANCTDEGLVELLKAVSEFGFERIAKREIPKALDQIDKAHAQNIQSMWKRAIDLCEFAVEREIEALRSVEEIFSGSEKAKLLLANRLEQWSIYRQSLQRHLKNYSQYKAAQLEADELIEPEPDDLEKEYAKVFPSVHQNVLGKEFSLERSTFYRNYIKEHPLAIKKIGLGRTQQRAILNYINGERSISKIKKSVAAETGRDLSFKKLIEYLKTLEAIGWIHLSQD
jgi:hypothetical protein